MAGIKERLIQFVLRGKNELSPEAKKGAEALKGVRQEADALGKTLDSAKDARGLVKSLESTQRAAAQAERSLVQTDLQIKELRDALTKAPESAGLQQSLKDAERESRRAQKALDDLQTKLRDQEKAAKAAGIDTSKLANEEKRLAAEVDSAKQALAGNAEQLKVLQREQAAAGRAAAEHTTRMDSARQAMTAGAKQVLVFAAAYISLNAAFGLVQKGLNLVRDGIYSMLETGDKFELLDKRMASLMGSVAGGEQATEWIKRFAKDTPLEVADVTEAFALLKSFGLDPMDGSLQAIVDKNEQLGGGMERLTGISSALGQAYGKQKLQTEEILQLIERGVPAWTMLEKVTGKNTSQLAKLATEGRLGKDVIKALINEMGKSADGAAAANMGTLTGLVSNLKDTWSDFLDRISKSGAMDAVKNKLKEVAGTIDQMDKDGRLDKLASALSKAFVDGATKVEAFAKKLLDIDFKQLADDSTKWLNGFGTGLDSALNRLDTFSTTTRGLWNMFTGLASGSDAFFGAVKLGVLEVAGLLADTLPEALGGQKMKAAVDAAAKSVRASIKQSIDGVKEDAGDLGAVFDGLASDSEKSADRQANAAKTSAREQTDVVAHEIDQRRMLDQGYANDLIANQQKVKDAAIAAAVEGKAAITDMANAMQLIDSTKSVQQLEGLRAALLRAYQDGKLSQDEYANATNVLNGKLKDLGGAASGAAAGVSDLEEKLGDLKSVQAAISNAKTDVDFNNITAALRKLYGDGKITAAQYNEELKKSGDRHKELKAAVDTGKKSQDDKNKSDQEAIKTGAQLRQESGKRMEEERRASGEAMVERRKGAESAKSDMAGVAGFFDGVMSRAREPLAAMSAAALDAFDKLRGISTVDMSMDTGNLDETTASLTKATQALGEMQAATNTPMASSLGRWMADTAVASQKIQVAFLGQKAQLQSLMEGYEQGGGSLESFISAAQGARSSLNLLNDSDLRTLEGAIEGARQKMQQLQEGSKATLTSLSEELMGLRGETEALERSKFASRRADLQQQIVEAQKGGDSTALNNLQQAMATLRQIEAETGQKRQTDEQQKRVDAVNNAAKATQPAANQAPAQIIRLQSAKGQTVDVAVRSDDDKTNLLGVLEDAGLRSL